jgi:predicted RNase H-like HicB family nuclease
MRIYIQSSQDQYFASAPEVPGVVVQGHSKKAAAAACRALIEEELSCYESLGFPLPVAINRIEIENREESEPSIFPEELQPASREFIRAVLRRTEELRAELDDFLDSLAPQEWEQRPQGEWNVRMLLDHIASTQWLILQGLDPWPLDPMQAQETALEELFGALITMSPRGRTRISWHFGLNQENERVSWTAGKIVRVVSSMQEQWLDYFENEETEPNFPHGHENVAGDGEAPSDDEIMQVRERGRRLLTLSSADKAIAGRVALRYRYYRNRLVIWPEEPRQRWDTVWQLTRSRLLSLSDADLSLVRVAPGTAGYDSGYSTVRQALGLTLAHLRTHFIQMKRTVRREE